MKALISQAGQSRRQSLVLGSVRPGSYLKGNTGSLLFLGLGNSEADRRILKNLPDFEQCQGREYIDQLSQVQNRKLRDTVYQADRTLKKAKTGFQSLNQWLEACETFILIIPIFIAIGCPLAGTLYARKASKQIQKIPDDDIRYQWIKKLINIYRYKEGSTSFHLAGYRAIPSIQNTQRRDELIKLACHHERSKVRRLGARFLPLVTNPQLKEELINKLSLDPKNSVKRALQRSLTKLDGSQTTAMDSLEEDEKLETSFTSQTMAEVGQNMEHHREIDRMASEMAVRLKTHFDNKPMVRQALLAQYENEQNLPNGDALKRQFIKLAHQHLKDNRGTLARLLRRKPGEGEVLKLARKMMEVAYQTGGFLMPTNTETYLKQFEQVEKQREAIRSDIEKARKVIAQQALFSAHAQDDLQNQQATIARLEADLEKAAQEKAHTREVQINKQLNDEREALKETEQRKKVFDTNYALAQARVETLTNRIDLLYRRLSDAMQYSMLDISKEELDTLMANHEGKETQPDLMQFLERADDQKYELMAEQQIGQSTGREKNKQEARQTR